MSDNGQSLKVPEQRNVMNVEYLPAYANNIKENKKANPGYFGELVEKPCDLRLATAGIEIRELDVRELRTWKA